MGRGPPIGTRPGGGGRAGPLTMGHRDQLLTTGPFWLAKKDEPEFSLPVT